METKTKTAKSKIKEAYIWAFYLAFISFWVIMAIIN